MKKLILIFSMMISAAWGYGQSFKTVKIDSLVSVTLPTIYTLKDTLGQQTFSGKSSYGFIVVTRIPNATNNAPLKKEKDLKKVFKSYTNDVKLVGGGTILNDRDTTVGNLKAHLFTLRTDDNNGTIQFRRFLFIYTRDVTYTFQYFYNDLQSDFVKDEINKYFSSVKISPELRRNDQYLAISGDSGGFGAFEIALYGAGVVVILIVVYTVVKRRRRNATLLS